MTYDFFGNLFYNFYQCGLSLFKDFLTVKKIIIECNSISRLARTKIGMLLNILGDSAKGEIRNCYPFCLRKLSHKKTT